MLTTKFSELVAANDNLAGRFRGFIKGRDVNKYQLEDETFVVAVHNISESTSHSTLLAMKNGWTYHLDSCPDDTSVYGAITLPFCLQHHRSRVCAIYVLYFASGLFRGESLENLMRVFTYDSPISNDICMIEWFRQFIDVNVDKWFDRDLLPRIKWSRYTRGIAELNRPIIIDAHFCLLDNNTNKSVIISKRLGKLEIKHKAVTLRLFSFHNIRIGQFISGKREHKKVAL